MKKSINIVFFSLILLCPILVACKQDNNEVYQLPFEREELDSFSVSSFWWEETLTFTNPEECDEIMEFFDSLTSAVGIYNSNAMGSYGWDITFHLSDGTEKKVLLLEQDSRYFIKKGIDYYWCMNSKIDFYDMFSDVEDPQIMVDGNLYYWDAKKYPSKGFEEYGQILEVIDDTPTKDCQLMARFEATGTVYTNETNKDAVYVEMSINGATNCWVRFVSSELAAGYSVFLNEKVYDCNIYNFDGSYDVLQELPSTCEYIGDLHYIGDDRIPRQDFETNCPSDFNKGSLEGREVYFDADDPDYIYVYRKKYWREGEYDTYIKCPIRQ